MTATVVAGRGRFALAFFAGFLGCLGFAPWNLWPLTLAALALLLVQAEAAPTHRARLAIGWWFGFGYFLLGTHWIAEAFNYQSNLPHAAGWAGVFLLSLFLAIFPALAVAAARSIAASRWPLVLALAGSWTVGEWLKSWVLTGFPWNPLGAVLLPVPGAAQAASVVGAFGLTIVVCLSAGAGLELVRRHWIAGMILSVPIVIAAATGIAATRGPSPVSATRLQIVQANIGQDEKWSAGGLERSLAKYLRLSPAPRSTPRLLIWPEAAVPDLLDEMPVLRSRLGSRLGPNDLMLLGALKAIRDGTGRAIAARNSLFVLDPSGSILERYDKKRLVPFGEFLPLRGVLDFIGLARLAPGELDFWPGPGPRTLSLTGYPSVGPLICYEVIFGGHVVEPGYRPEWLLNISNDAWFAGAGAEMHLAQARLRSIEEGLPMARSTPTGISAVIDPKGRVIASIGRGRTGVLDTVLPLAEPPTLFSRYGNLVALMLALALCAAGFVTDRRR